MDKEKVRLEHRIKQLEISQKIHLLFIFIIVGGFMNVIAIASNGGQMPVITDEFEYESTRHKTYIDCEGVANCWMTDNIKLGNWYISLGDIMIIVGAVGAMILSVLKTIINYKHRRRIKQWNTY